MTLQVAVNDFDRGKPFYPLVMHYLAQLIGFKELALRGIVGPANLEELAGRIPALATVPAGSEGSIAEVREKLRELCGPLELWSEYQNNHIRIDIDQIAREIAANISYLMASTMRSAGNLLILAHELSKDSSWHDTGPLWEFLRHCRHAAAHGGRFNFLHGEPRRPATWGTFAIVPTLRGTALFRGASGAGLLSPGDPIRLLWDIEQAYPQMRA